MYNQDIVESESIPKPSRLKNINLAEVLELNYSIILEYQSDIHNLVKQKLDIKKLGKIKILMQLLMLLNQNANFPKYEYEWAIKLMIYHVNTNQYNINEEVIITKKITKILKQLAINYKNNLRNNDIEDNGLYKENNCIEENNAEEDYNANKNNEKMIANDDERNKDFEENYSTEDDNERNDDFDEEVSSNDNIMIQYKNQNSVKFNI
ncbi:hypothetical protein C2G38_2202081 [Gigaspora rosea]|uniref:Uncharacterized protein n=1 Tax=Gigaspora rosea TaxID=44941 RepID=A0A397URV3_9GLOM|nr:hypothetical protein C2G38_2202081 [Gigaspora rosea]